MSVTDGEADGETDGEAKSPQTPPYKFEKSRRIRQPVRRVKRRPSTSSSVRSEDGKKKELRRKSRLPSKRRVRKLRQVRTVRHKRTSLGKLGPLFTEEQINSY